MEILEAVDFKDLEAKKAFNLAWKVKFKDLLLDKEINWVKIGKNSASKQRWYVKNIFVSGSDDLRIRYTLRIEAMNGQTKRYFSILDFKDSEYKKEHLECADPELNFQILSLIEAYLHDYNEAAKVSNRRERGEEGRITRTKKTADAVLKSPKCEELKAWLAEHIDSIYFRLPICSDPTEVVLDDTLEPYAFEKIAEKWQYAADKFLELWKPALVENKDFDYRDAVVEPETVSVWYNRRGPNCIIMFDCDLASSEIPDEINEMIALAKKEAEDAGVDRVVNYDVRGNKLDSYYFGRALGEIFNYDINFYKNAKPAEPQPEPEVDNPFDQEFDAVNAYGEKVESLTEGKEETCCICGEPIEGYGNNPEPYKHEGRCCDACNLKFVIPARLAQINNEGE